MGPEYERQRRHPRSPYKEGLEICLESGSQEIPLAAISTNISDSGLCIYTFKPLAVGQNIVFRSKLPLPHYRATVAWVKQYNQNVFKVGVVFAK